MKRILLLAPALACALLTLGAHAAEIAVLSAGAIEPGLKAAAGAFENRPATA